MEIEEERKKEYLSMEEHPLVGRELDDGIVLVACKDERSCMQLEDCITKCPLKVVFKNFHITNTASSNSKTGLHISKKFSSLS